jgi:hypothetical protein
MESTAVPTKTRNRSADAKARERARRESEIRWKAELRRRIPAKKVLNWDEWSLLIEDWQATDPDGSVNQKQRKLQLDRAAICAKTRHDDAMTPIGKYVCKRCLRYREDESRRNGGTVG